MSKIYSGLGNHTIDGENVKLEGINSFVGGKYNELKIAGVISIKGEVVANKLTVEGVVNANEKITAQMMNVTGVANLNGELRTKEASITGVVNLSSKKFESESINCEGVITAKGEISADKIYANGCISAKEVYGDDIKIYSNLVVSKVVQNIKSFLSNGKKKYNSKIEVIEATNITLEGVRCKNICGHNITIGKDCYIENIDCDGELKIEESSIVENVTGNCKREDVVKKEVYMSKENAKKEDDNKVNLKK